MKPEISIVFPFYNRKEYLYKTLEAYGLYDSVNDAEFIIVDDVSDPAHKLTDIHMIFPNLNIRVIEIEKADKVWQNCCTVPYNIGIKNAKSDIIAVTNPENFPIGDVIKSAIGRTKENTHVIYGCYSFDEAISQDIISSETNHNKISEIQNVIKSQNKRNVEVDGENGWYQHSIYRPKGYCFFATLTKNDFKKINGFNDCYADGTAYGDVDFIYRITQAGINVVQIDNPFVLHLYHYRVSNTEGYNSQELVKRNLDILLKTLETGIIPKTNKYSYIYKKYCE